MKSKNLNFLKSRRPFPFCAFIALGISCLPVAFAAELTWDTVAADAAITGGVGNWDTETANWTVDGGVNNIIWNNTNNDTAVFSGTGGIVTLTEPITAGGITFDSAHTVTGNILTLAGTTPTVTVPSGIVGTISSEIAGSEGLTKDGPGSLALASPTGNSFSGLTTINGGQLRINYGPDNAIPATSALVLNGGAFTALMPTTPSRTQTFAGTTLSSGVNALQVNKGASGTTVGLLTIGSITRNAGATLNLHLSHTGITNRRIQSSSWTSGTTITDNGVAYATFVSTASQATVVLTANDWAAYSGTTVQAATYTASTATELLGNANLTTGTDTTLAADTTITTLRNLLNENRFIDIGSDNTLTTGGILIGGGAAGTTTITGGTLRSAATVADRDLVVITHNGNLVIESVIPDVVAGATGFTKTGAGTVRLGGSNTFSGPTIVTGGTLISSRVSSLAISPAVSLTNGSTLGVGVGGLGSYTDPDITALLAKTTVPAEWNFAYDTTEAIDGIATVPGGYSASGELLKTGAGTLIFSGANTHATTTTVRAGTLEIQHPGALGGTEAGTSVLTNVAALGLSNGISVAGEALMIGGGGLSNTGALRNVSGNNAWTGDITLTATTRFTADSGTLTLNTVSGNNTTLVLNGAGNINFNNAITTGTGGLTIDNLNGIGISSGAFTLNGEDTFTGAVTVASGTLNMAGNRTTNTGAITVGSAEGQTGSLNLSNGIFTANGSVVVGGGFGTTTGIMNQTAGNLSTSTGGLVLVGSAGSTGTYDLSGGSLAANNSSNNSMILGVNTGSSGTFNLSGTGELFVQNFLQIGRSNNSAATGTTGVFNQTGGTATITNLAMGGGGLNNESTTSTLNLTGGTFEVTTGFPQLSNGPDSSSEIIIGGTADVTLPAFATARGANSTATITFDGGVLRPTASSLTYMEGLIGPVISESENEPGATIQDGGATFDVDVDKDILINQDLLTHPTSLGGGLTKLGDGILGLGGVNTYTGNTTVTAGALVLAPTGSLDAASTVNVGPNGALGGSGVAQGPVLSTGTIAPGDLVVGTLTVGTAILSGGSLDIEVSGSSADRLSSPAGVLDLTGATLNVTELNPGGASEFVIVEGSSISGPFAAENLPPGYSLDYTTNPNQVILKLAGSFGYSSWALDNNLDETNNGPNQDPDFDGISNLMEYVLGGIPFGPGAANTSILPVLEELTENDMIFTFNRSDDSIGDTVQIVQISTGLDGWANFATIGTETAGAVAIAPNGEDPDLVSVTIPRSNEENGKLFARLIVIKP